jgi:hypothetical protein
MRDPTVDLVMRIDAAAKLLPFWDTYDECVNCHDYRDPDLAYRIPEMVLQ